MSAVGQNGETALVLEGLVKRYGRINRTTALDHLSFSVPKGSICALIGPNGAGKTTCFSVVSGYLSPDAGTVDILGGGAFDPVRLKGRLGVLPQDAELGLRHSPMEYLEHLGRLQGLRAHSARGSARELMDRLNLGDRADERIASLSHGMRRRVAVASALVGDPELVLLDEPMSGLDPIQVASLRSFLGEQRGRRTLVVSSHNLAELELLCDSLVVLERGRCLYAGDIHNFTSRDVVAEWLVGEGSVDVDELRRALPDHDLDWDASTRTLTHRAPSESSLDAGSVHVAGALAAAGVAIRSVQRGKSLERGYLERADEA